MKICLLCEGSYPYITGGVSSWIQTIVNSMPEHEFIIYAIGAQEKNKGKFKYTLPPNIIEVKEVFLDSFLNEDAKWGKRFKLDDREEEALKLLLQGEQTNWSDIFSLVLNNHYQQVTDFLTSKDFFDIMYEVCTDKYSQIPFTEMFWTVRSMILPLFLLIKSSIPEADLYHSASTGYAGIIGALAKHIYNKPFLLTEHGIYSREREEEIIKANWIKGYFKDIWIQYFYNLSNCAYGYADRVLTLFNRNREIQIELGCPEERIRIIPNGVRVDHFAGIPQKQEDVTELNIGAVVRLVPIKDVKTMIQSYAIVKHEVPNAKFYIFGPTDEDPEYFQECEQLVAALDLQDAIVFTGSIQVRDYIGQMDVLVLTSISEGQPLAVLEAMACAKPMVTTDVGSCKELLCGVQDEFGQAGFVVPVMHYEEIGQNIIKLCKNKQMREEFGKNGLERAKALYSHDSFIESYRNLYQEYEVH